MPTSAQYAAKLEWEKGFEVKIQNWMKGFEAQVIADMKRIADYYAPIIEAWMKQNAIWNDITGNARAGLKAEVEQLAEDAVLISLDHTEPYGYWLELKNQGKYAIIQPALHYFAPQVFGMARTVLHGK